MLEGKSDSQRKRLLRNQLLLIWLSNFLQLTTRSAHTRQRKLVRPLYLGESWSVISFG